MSQINVDIIRSRTGTAATCDKGLVVSGVTTASGGVVGDVTGTLTGTATGLSGSPTITVTDITAQNITAVGATFTGTVSYENIQNLDSVGLVTARAGLNVGPLTGIAATIDIGGNIDAGIVTATSFYGDGANLSNVISGVELQENGSSAGAAITAINFASGASITDVSAGISTISIAAGLGTALGDSSPLDIIFKTPVILNVAAGTTINITSDDTSGNVAFMRQSNIHVGSGSTVTIGAGTTLIPDVLGIFNV